LAQAILAQAVFSLKLLMFDGPTSTSMSRPGLMQTGAIARTSLTLRLVVLVVLLSAEQRSAKSDISCRNVEEGFCSNGSLAVSPSTETLVFLQVQSRQWKRATAISEAHHGVVDNVHSEGCWTRIGSFSANFSLASKAPSTHSSLIFFSSIDHATHVAMTKLLATPAFALVVGISLVCVRALEPLGKLAAFFGAQSGMNLYMKMVLGSVVLFEKNDCELRGIPAPFLVTGIQQLVSFTGLCSFIALSRLTPWQYKPQVLEKHHIPVLLALSFSFTLNIALNNASLTLIDVSTNQVIRSLTPLAILVVQATVSCCIKLPSKHATCTSRVLLLLSACFGLLSVLAKETEPGQYSGSFQTHLFGIVLCTCSVFSSGLELIIVAILGSSVRLNPIDVVVYMAIPTLVLLSFPAVLWSHPVSWMTTPSMTDVEILRDILRLNPSMLWLLILSGLFAMFYNLFLYYIVQTMSPLLTACASNFNKFASITLSFAFGLELIPKSTAGVMMIAGLVGNLVTLTFFGIVESRPHSEDRVQSK